MTDRETFGLSLCISGQITYTMNGKTYTCTPDTAVLLPQGSTYSLSGDKDGLFPVVNFTCSNFSCEEILVVPLEQPQVCIHGFETLKNLFERGDGSLELYSTFYELLGKVFSTRRQCPAALDAAVAYIGETLQDPELSNTAIAEVVGISEVYLRKLFVSYYGITPKQYVLEARFRKARQLLTEAPFSIRWIAEECGFSSVYHFCRAFKKRTDMTPTQYAAKHIRYTI